MELEEGEKGALEGRGNSARWSSVWAGAGRAGCLVWFPQKQTLRQSSMTLGNTSWKLGSEARKGGSLG